VKAWFLGSTLTVAAAVSLPYAYFESYRLDAIGIFIGTLAVTFMSVVFVAALGFSLCWHLSGYHSLNSGR
jgi:hypothetical protein